LPPVTAPGICRRDVADHQEAVGQLARGIEQREVLLVGLHGEDQAFLRHLQKLGIKAAHQHVGPLDQCGDLVQQGRIRDHLRAVTHTLAGVRDLPLDRSGDVAKNWR
jgi:hypothetical protein